MGVTKNRLADYPAIYSIVHLTARRRHKVLANRLVTMVRLGQVQ
jgi:hypothetical protein